MKKLFLFFIVFFFSFSSVFSCSIPPDILNRFLIYEEDWKVKIDYSLYTWEDFKIQINNDFKTKTKKDLNKENIKIFIENYIKKSSFLSLNWTPIELNFESVKFFENISSWDPYFEITFQTQFKELEDKNIFEINYKKNIFSNLTDLSHSYLYSKIEENLEFEWYTNFFQERFHNYFFEGKKYWILSFLKKENDEEVIYVLKINKLWNDDRNIEWLEKVEKNENPLLKNNNNPSFFEKIRKYFENFLQKELSIFEIILWFIFAIIFWALHWLLPWHAKSILWAYIINEKQNKKEIIILILSVTLSHTFFIFLLAFLINLLNLWVWSSSLYINYFSSFLYIIFWIYFLNFSIKNIFKKEKKHSENCSCCHQHKHKENKNSFKKSITFWILFWCNPCLDALVLFLFALSIWNIKFAILILIAFSLGLWLMLWFIAFFLWKWKKIIFDKKWEKIKKIINFLTLILWILIIIIWILWLLK